MDALHSVDAWHRHCTHLALRLDTYRPANNNNNNGTFNNNAPGDGGGGATAFGCRRAGFQTRGSPPVVSEPVTAARAYRPVWPSSSTRRSTATWRRWRRCTSENAVRSGGASLSYCSCELHWRYRHTLCRCRGAVCTTTAHTAATDARTNRSTCGRNPSRPSVAVISAIRLSRALITRITEPMIRRHSRCTVTG